MATVKSIDVALRATTGNFDKAILKSAGISNAEFNKMRKDLTSTAPAADRLRESMRSLAKLVATGAMTHAQAAEASSGLRRELKAGKLGFDSYADAQSKALAITRQNETEAEKLSKRQDELNRLLKSGAIDQQSYNREAGRMAAETANAAASQARLRTDLQAAANGFRGHSDAQSKALAITRRNETAQERQARQMRELNRLYRTGTLSQSAYAREARRLGGGSGALGQVGSSLTMAVSSGSRFAPMLSAFGPAGMAAAVGIGTATAALAPLAAGLALFGRETQNQFGPLDKLGKAADKLGIGVAELVAIRMAASEASGMSADQTDQALQRMTRRIAEAGLGMGEAKGAIAELGLEAKALSKLSPDQAFREISRAIGEIEGKGNQLRIAFKLFDSEGAKLVSTLRGGPEALDDAARFARRFGIELRDSQVNAVEAANDAVGRLGTVWEGVFQQAAAGFAPAVKTVADDILDAADGFNRWDQAFQQAGASAAALFGTMKDIRGIALSMDPASIMSGIGGEGRAQAIQDTVDNIMEARRQARLDKRENAAKAASDAAAKVQEEAAKKAESLQGQFGDPSERFAKSVKELEGVKLDPTTMRGALDNALAQFESSLSGVDVFGEPAERLRQQIAEVRDSFQAGLITEADANRLTEGLVSGFGSAVKSMGGDAKSQMEQVQEAFDDLTIGKGLFDSLASDITATTATAADQAAESLVASLRTPADVLSDQLAEYDKLLELGKITEAQRDLASERAREAAEGPTKDRADVGLAKQGSVEAFQAELKTRQTEGQKQIDEAKRQNAHLAQLVGAADRQIDVLENLEPVQVV